MNLNHIKQSSKAILFLVAFYLGIANLYAQQASLRMDTTSMRIGEQRNVYLEFKAPVTCTLRGWPSFTDSLNQGVEVVSRSTIDSILSSDKKVKTFRQLLRITSFDSGYQTIPSFKFSYLAKGETAIRQLSTDSVIFNVSSVAVDTTKAIKDIKGNFGAPWTFAELIPFLLGALGVLLIAAFIYYYLWRKRNNKPLISLVRRVKIPPYQEALDALTTLKEKHLWQEGLFKEYHTEITDILRHYLDDQFDFGAAEMTTDEIMDTYGRIQINQTVRGKLFQILTLADLVKFAKERPLPDENDLSLMNAVEFVTETRPNPKETHEDKNSDHLNEENSIEINEKIRA